MKRAERIKLERKLAAYLNEDQAPDEARLAEMMEVARQAVAARQTKEAPQPKWKSHLRRAMAACLLAMAFLVGSFVYTAVVPAKVGEANNAIRSMTLWINEKLHLGFTFDVPVSDKDQLDEVEPVTGDYASVEEAASATGLTLAALDEQASGFHLASVDVMEAAGRVRMVTLIYRHGEDQVQLRIHPLSGGTKSGGVADCGMIETALGTLYVWSDASGQQGTLEHAMFTLHVDASMTDAAAVWQCLRIVN